MIGVLRLGSRLLSATGYSNITSRRTFHASTSTQYEYKPLRTNEIRVIDLPPRRQVEPLRCALRNVTLTRSVSYEALSYCWGANKLEEEIVCDDGSIAATKSLFIALQHLRQDLSWRTLWIDAICINQADLEERGQQVNLMKDIFQRSERTVVWLGEDSEDSDRAVSLIQQLAAASQKRTSARSGWTHELTTLPPLYDPAWRALVGILQRPWFRRAWVVQEVSVARDISVVCGKACFSWDEFVRAMLYAVDLGILIADGGSTAYQALRLFTSRSNFQRNHLPLLQDVLISNRTSLATDARDKVFGLLSLADKEDVQALGVHPDYHLSVVQLYKRVAISLLKRSDLSVFDASCIHSNALNEKLPSWVPDWSTADPSVPLTSSDWSDHEHESFSISPAPAFSASKASTSSPVFNREENLLGLSGVLVDQVESIGALSRTRYLRHVSHMFELFAQCRDRLEQLRDWETIAKARSLGTYITGEKCHDAYWHTLCAGRNPPTLISARKDPRFKYYIIIRSLRPFVQLTIRWFPRTQKDTWYNRLFYSMFQASWRGFGLTPAKIQRIGFPPMSRLSNYRRMIRTKKGYIALAPRFTREGDWIGVFKGGKMPLVVRKEGEHCVLIGEAYVHGIMNGEVWDQEKCERMWFK